MWDNLHCAATASCHHQDGASVPYTAAPHHKASQWRALWEHGGYAETV